MGKIIGESEKNPPPDLLLKRRSGVEDLRGSGEKKKFQKRGGPKVSTVF